MRSEKMKEFSFPEKDDTASIKLIDVLSNCKGEKCIKNGIHVKILT